MTIQNKHIAVLQFITLVVLAFIARFAFVSSGQPTPIEKVVDLESVRATIQTSMPNTPIRSVMPAPIKGLYEITSDTGLLYTDETGRFLFVGGIYDPQTNTDIVAKRKEELGFNTKAKAQAKEQTAPTANNQQKAGPYPMSKVTFDSIKDYAITYREIEGAPVVYELFDPMCGYCRKNHAELEKLNVTIKKLLIVTQGSQEINQQVYCSVNPSKTIDSLMTSNAIITDGTSRANCDVRDLAKIRDWMDSNGIGPFTPQSILYEKEQLWRGAASAQDWKTRLGL